MIDRGLPIGFVVFATFASVLAWVCALVGQVPVR